MPLPDAQLGRLANTDEPPTAAMDTFLAQLSPEDLRHLQDRIFDRLSPWDLIHLRSRIRTKVITGLRTLEDLPLDVVCLIADCLNPRDLLAATQVSRQCRVNFASRAVLKMACSHLFPGLAESLSVRPDTDLLGPFRKTLRLYGIAPDDDSCSRGRHFNGHPCDSTYTSWEGRTTKPDTAYSDGHLAYQVAHLTKVVNIRDGSTRNFVAPADRRKAVKEQIVAISKHILVVAQSQTDRPNQWRVLRILSLATSGDEQNWQTKVLPAGLDRCYADGWRVVLTCQNGQAFHWRWGGDLAELPVCAKMLECINAAPRLKRVAGKGPGAIFHPHEKICYLVHLYAAGPFETSDDDATRCPPRVFVVKYTQDQHGAWSPVLPVEQCAVNQPEYLIHLYRQFNEGLIASGRFEYRNRVELACKKADNHGSFLLAVRWGEGPQGSGPYFGVAVSFNVFTECYYNIQWGDTGHAEHLPVPVENPERAGIPREDISRICVWNRCIYKRDLVASQPDPGDKASWFDIDLVKPKTNGLHWASPGILNRYEFHRKRSADPSSSAVQVDLYADDDFVVTCHGNGFAVHPNSSCAVPSQGPDKA